MRKMSRFSKVVFACIAGIVMMLMTIAFAQPANAGRPLPGPLCGPTILFICSGPGSDDVLVGLTRCEVDDFERQTGLTCVPYGG